MNILKGDGTVDENAAGEYAYTANNPAGTSWSACHESIKPSWRTIGAVVAARVRQELEEIYKTREANALSQFAAGIFGECHSDCKATFFDPVSKSPDSQRSLLWVVQAMRKKIDSQTECIQRQGERIKASGGAYEVETLRETFKSLDSQLQQAISRADKLEKTSALWCDRFIEVTKANSEIGMALVEMMVRHGVEPPANEQAAVAARETRSGETPAGYTHLSCLACGGTGWNGGDMKGDEPDCPQCNGAGSILARKK